MENLKENDNLKFVTSHLMLELKTLYYGTKKVGLLTILKNTMNELLNINSAVAFFFLFFCAAEHRSLKLLNTKNKYYECGIKKSKQSIC